MGCHGHHAHAHTPHHRRTAQNRSASASRPPATEVPTGHASAVPYLVRCVCSHALDVRRQLHHFLQRSCSEHVAAWHFRAHVERGSAGIVTVHSLDLLQACTRVTVAQRHRASSQQVSTLARNAAMFAHACTTYHASCAVVRTACARAPALMHDTVQPSTLHTHRRHRGACMTPARYPRPAQVRGSVVTQQRAATHEFSGFHTISDRASLSV